MAKIAQSQKQKQNLILLNILSYSMNTYIGSNRETQTKARNQENAKYHMNLAYKGFFSFYLAPSSGERKYALVHSKQFIELNSLYL